MGQCTAITYANEENAWISRKNFGMFEVQKIMSDGYQIASGCIFPSISHVIIIPASASPEK
jgi:hypothetical protein